MLLLQKQLKKICKAYLKNIKENGKANKLYSKSKKTYNIAEEIHKLTNKINDIDLKIRQTYSDRLSGLLDEEDFQVFYKTLKKQRNNLQEGIKRLEIKSLINPQDDLKHLDILIADFLNAVEHNRELLVSLIERVEVTQDKKVIIRFRFKELESFYL